MNRTTIIRDAAPHASEALTEVGLALRAGAEKLWQELHGRAPQAGESETQAVLGPMRYLLATDKGDHIGLFQSGKAVTQYSDGGMRLSDAARVPTDLEHQRRWVLYDGTLSGKPLVESILDLKEYPLAPNRFSFNRPRAVTTVLEKQGADESFLDRAVPAGSVPNGLGSGRIAFVTPDKDVSLVGPSEFRPPVPNMLFPTQHEVHKGIQFERLPRTYLSRITQGDTADVAESTKRVAWDFWDDKKINLGRLKNKQLMIIDSNSVERLTGPVLIDFDHVGAATIYRHALNDATIKFGKDSHPVGGFNSELGWHYRGFGNHQRAEEHLSAGLNILEKHQDWLRVHETADRLSAVYNELGQPRRAKEFTARSIRARELWNEWAAAGNAK